MGARFKALDEGVLAAALKSTGYFVAISISQKVRCWGKLVLPPFENSNLIPSHSKHRTFWEIEMAKKYPVDFEAAARTPSSTA